jgi:hypothetical protein
MAKQAILDEGRKPTGKTPSLAERAARDSMEALRRQPLCDSEWALQSKRLTEFVKLLYRWDAEQRVTAKCAMMESKNSQEGVA